MHQGRGTPGGNPPRQFLPSPGAGRHRLFVAILRYPHTMRSTARLVLVLAILCAAPASARQDPVAVRTVIEDYLHVQTKGLPGQVSFTVGALDPANALASCRAMEVTLAPGARAWGRTNVQVRCPQAGGWTVFIPVHIRVIGEYLVANRPIAQGQVISEADLGRQSGDLADLPAGILIDAPQATGRTALMSVPAGRPLRGDMLRQATVVLQGQSVKVVSKGPGFQVANEGRALNNAAEGQVAQVRLANGQVVSGIARGGGYVEVGF